MEISRVKNDFKPKMEVSVSNPCTENVKDIHILCLISISQSQIKCKVTNFVTRVSILESLYLAPS